MALEARIVELAQTIGADIKALNQLISSNTSVIINDASISQETTYSSQKLETMLGQTGKGVDRVARAMAFL